MQRKMKQPLVNPYPVWANLLADPLHILFLRLLTKAFGTFRQKAYMNVLPRGGYAYGVLRGAYFGRRFCQGFQTMAEFGVASGAGLDMLCRYAKHAWGWKDIVGFDTGCGMPSPGQWGWENHPEVWQAGDYSPDCDLKEKFDGRATVVIGDIQGCDYQPRHPITFAAIDMDYYTSSLAALEYLSEFAAPFCSVYCDDVGGADDFCTASDLRGQLLAIKTFNDKHGLACCVTRDRTLPGGRLVRHAAWHDHMYIMHRNVPLPKEQFAMAPNIPWHHSDRY